MFYKQVMWFFIVQLITSIRKLYRNLRDRRALKNEQV